MPTAAVGASGTELPKVVKRATVGAMSRLWICSLSVLLLATLPSCGQSLRLHWRYPTGGRIRSEPAVAPDGTIYALSEDGFLYAFSASGKVEQRTNLGGLPADSLSIGPDGTAYAGLNSGSVIAVNPRGHIIWHFDAAGALLGDPVIANDGTIFVANAKGNLFSLALNGTLEWKITLPSRMTLAPLLDAQETLYFGGADRRLYALTRWGRFLWSTPLGGVPVSGSVASDGTVYVVLADGAVVGVSPRGDIAWRAPAGTASFGPLIGEERIFVALRNGQVEALSRAGKPLWKKKVATRLGGRWAVGRGRLYIAAAGDTVSVVNTSDGSLLATDKVGSLGGLCLAPSGDLLIGGQDWLVYDYAGALFDPRAQWPLRSGDGRHSGHGRGRFQEAAALQLLAELPDYVALNALFDPSRRGALSVLLEELQRRIDGGALGKSRWYVRRLLEQIASVGILRPAVEGDTVVNDFPTVRAQAVVLLGGMASLDVRSFLIRLLGEESDPYAAAKEIEALGRIGSDVNGGSTRAIAAAFLRFAARGGTPVDRIAQATVTALASIARYEGALADPSGRISLLMIHRGPYSSGLRDAALALLVSH